MPSPRQNLNRLQNKKICMLGFGIENQALVKFLLKKKVACEITICDARKKQIFEGEQTFVRLQKFYFSSRRKS